MAQKERNLKKKLFTMAGLICIAWLISGVSVALSWNHTARASSCLTTGYFRDSMFLTAAVIATTGSPNVSNTSVNASGCNIGVYYPAGVAGSVTNVEIFGANYYGVVNNGGNAQILNSRIHDIGESPLNGDQHGVGIYFVFGVPSKGKIVSNLIWNYQKGGIVVNGTASNATVSISHNTVIGQGPISYIAQNGIQIGYGAKATVSNNMVSGNSYTGAGLTASGGIIVVGGSCYTGPLTIGTKITGNQVIGNDIGIWLSNLDGTTCIPTNTPTNILASHNIATYDAINNTTGAGAGAAYQAGVADQGDADQIVNNSICGLGYTPVTTPPPYLLFIDVTATNNAVDSGNTSCLDGSSVALATAATKSLHNAKHPRLEFVR
jgi:Right handed beta helix region